MIYIPYPLNTNKFSFYFMLTLIWLNKLNFHLTTYSRFSVTSFCVVYSTKYLFVVDMTSFPVVCLFSCNVRGKQTFHKALLTHNHVLSLLFLVCIHVLWFFCYCLRWHVKKLCRVGVAISVTVWVIWNPYYHTLIEHCISLISLASIK